MNGTTFITREVSKTLTVPTTPDREGYTSSSVSVAYSGYTPLCVAGYTMPSAWHRPYIMRISGTTLNFSIRCDGLTAVEATFRFLILYRKN